MSAEPDTASVWQLADGDTCQNCGSVLVGEGCPACYQRSYFDSSSPTGEAGLTSDEYSRVLGRNGVSKRERNFLNSLTFDEEDRKIHNEVERWFRAFQLAPSDVLAVEETAKSLRKKGESITDAVVAAIVKNRMEFGLSIVEIVRRLGEVEPSVVAGRSLRARLLSLTTAKVDVSVNGFPRSAKIFREVSLKLHGEERDVLVARVPLSIRDDDALLRFGNAEVLEVKTNDGKEDRRAKLVGTDTVKLSIDARKCFRPFKILKRLRVDLSVATSHEADRKYWKHITRSPLSVMPCTEALLRESGYLNKLQMVFYKKYQAHARNSDGRSPALIAREALREASVEVFNGLDPSSKMSVRGKAVRLSSATSDAWSEGDGFVFRSELLRIGA